MVRAVVNRPKPIHSLLRLTLACATVCLTAACDPFSSGGSSRARPVGPDLQGKWSGEYYVARASDAQRQAITATIKHDGDAIILKTSKSGTGANLTGTIDDRGEITLIDAFDGEDWTTFFGPATTNRVRVADFLYDSELGAQSPLAVIDLSR